MSYKLQTFFLIFANTLYYPSKIMLLKSRMVSSRDLI